jgi:DNA repair exonuclease SbcCD ATPase subunit
MNLDKQSTIAAIEKKLDTLNDQLTKLGDLVEQEAKQQEKLTGLREGEKEIFADSTLSESKKINSLLRQRATFDVAKDDLEKLQASIRDLKVSVIGAGIEAHQLVDCLSAAVRQARKDQCTLQLTAFFEERFLWKLPELLDHAKAVKEIDDLERPMFVGANIMMLEHEAKNAENSNLEYCHKLRSLYETLAKMSEAHSELLVPIPDSWIQ